MQLTGRSRAPGGAVFSLFLSSAVSHAQSPQPAAETPVSATSATNQAMPAPPGGPHDVITDSTWNTLIGRHVELHLVDGSLRDGTIAGFDDTTVTFLVKDDLYDSVVRKDIRELRVTGAGAAVAHGPTPPPRPDMHTNEYRGTGRIITGKVITSVGGVYTGLGIIGLAISLGAGTDDGVPFGLSSIMWGAVHLAVGIPLLISGKRARERYDMRMGTLERSGRPRLTPLAAPLRGGFTAGFALSF